MKNIFCNIRRKQRRTPLERSVMGNLSEQNGGNPVSCVQSPHQAEYPNYYRWWVFASLSYYTLICLYMIPPLSMNIERQFLVHIR